MRDNFTSVYERLITDWDGNPKTITTAGVVEIILGRYDSVVDREVHRTTAPEAITIITFLH